MNIPKHVLNCPWVGQQHDILSFCEHLILILRLSSILSQNDNSAGQNPGSKPRVKTPGQKPGSKTRVKNPTRGAERQPTAPNLIF